MWSNRAWQSRLWCSMGLQSTLSSICVSLQVTGHRSRPAMEHRKRQRSGTGHSSPGITQPHSTSEPGSSYSPLQTPLLPLPKKGRVWFLNLSSGQDPAGGREWEEGPGKHSRSLNDTGKKNCTALITQDSLTPRIQEKVIFPSHHQTPLDMQKGGRACTLITYFQAEMETLLFTADRTTKDVQGEQKPTWE